MTDAAPKLTISSTNPAVMVEQQMSRKEAEMYVLLRDYRCTKGLKRECPGRIIIGRAGVVLDCPTCGWVGQTYPQDESGDSAHLPAKGKTGK